MIYLGLVDLLFAYCFDYRINEGEVSIESAWNIVHLSSQLSTLDKFHSLNDVCLACYRRALAYPLYRHWGLTKKVLFEDVVHTLRYGKRGVMRALLSLKRILSDEEDYDRVASIWIIDYCVWARSCSNRKLQLLADALEEIVIEKVEIGWDLDEWEKLVQESVTNESSEYDSSSHSESEFSDSSHDDSKLCEEIEALSLNNETAEIHLNVEKKVLIQELDDNYE